MKSSSRRAITAAALITASALLLANTSATAAPAPALARFHLALSRSEPPKDRTVGVSPKVVKLWFTETVRASATRVKITGAGKHDVALSGITIDTVAKSPAVAEIKEALKPGSYVVDWKTMSADGHPSTGTFVFTVSAKAAN
ncbi:MAG: copper resistance protein CopC [Phycisphaerae bacterium]|nr:copper resistance protein CopC [Gemmatimonadaceae bacterium]